MFDQVCVCVLQVIGNSRPSVSYNSGLLFAPELHLGFLPGLTTEFGTSWRDGARPYPPIEVATNAGVFLTLLIKLVGGEAEAGKAWPGWVRVLSLRVAMETMRGYVLLLLSCLERSNVVGMIGTEAGLGCHLTTTSVLAWLALLRSRFLSPRRSHPIQ